MDKIIEKLGNIGIVPVVVIDDASQAAPLAEALCKGGLPAAEVTFRTANRSSECVILFFVQLKNIIRREHVIDQHLNYSSAVKVSTRKTNCLIQTGEKICRLPIILYIHCSVFRLLCF